MPPDRKSRRSIRFDLKSRLEYGRLLPAIVLLVTLPMPALPRNLFTLRFSIRSMFVVVTILCVVIGWRVNRLYQNQRAIDSLGRRGLHVQQFVWPPRTHDLSFWTHVNVDELVLWGAEAPEEKYPPVVPEFWSYLSKLTPLNSIAINNVNLPSREQSRGSNRRCNATEVEFHSCRFHTDAFQNAIEQLPRLKTLSVIHGTLDSRSLSCLSRCGSLESLELGMDSFPTNAIATFEGKQLRCLHLFTSLPEEQTPIEKRIELSPEDVKTIMAMENLEELSIGVLLAFPAASLPQLRNCKRLKVLAMNVTNISKADLEAAQHDLAAALPDCEVDLYYSPNP